MLVLTRKKNQSLKLGDNIEIKVLEVNGDQVRIGISAPADVRVLRKELYVDIQKQNVQASALPQDLKGLGNITKKKIKPECNKTEHNEPEASSDNG